MDDVLSRFLDELVGRTSGPFTFRFVIQPLMAVFYALRDGARDARAGRPPYFWAIFTHAAERRELLRDGLTSVGRIMGLGAVMDLVYQLMVFRAIHPLQLIVIVLALAFLPYLLLRGPINRLLRRRIEKSVHP